MQGLNNVRKIDGAQDVLPYEAGVVTGVVAQVLVQVKRSVTNRLLDNVTIVLEEQPSLENWTTFFLHEFLRRIVNWPVGVAFEVVGVDVDVPGVSEVGESFGEEGFVQSHGVLVAVDGGQVVPVVLEFLAGHQALAVGVEVGLDVLGQVAEGAASEGVERYLVELGDAPEVEVSLVHGVEHRGEGVDGAHDGGVEQDDFVEFGERVPSVGVHGGLVCPCVESLVGAHGDVAGVPGEFGASLVGELAVAYDGHLGEVGRQPVEQRGHVVVHHALRVVEEEDAQPVHGPIISKTHTTNHPHKTNSANCIKRLTECYRHGRNIDV